MTHISVYTKRTLLLVTAVLFSAPVAHANFSTNIGTGADAEVVTAAIQNDGKILIAGSLNSFNGVTTNKIARLNSDGTLDTSFTSSTGTGFDSSVSAIAIQSDGKILVAGSFSSFNGLNTKGIARLNTDGTLDTAFASSTGTGFGSSAANAVAVQSDGKIVVGGAFTLFNGLITNNIARLNADGTLDTAFASSTGTGFVNASNPVYDVAIQSDGKILAGGSFSSFNGLITNNIARLNTDGTLDTTFASSTGSGFNQYAESLDIQSDGKILVGGAFSSFKLLATTRVARLNADGTLDTSFASSTGTGFNAVINAITHQSDGKILAGGSFTSFSGLITNYIARLNTDGTLDTAFASSTGAGFNLRVDTLGVQSDGKIFVGGNFTAFKGVTINRVGRLNSDGTEDSVVTTPPASTSGGTSSWAGYGVYIPLGVATTTLATSTPTIAPPQPLSYQGPKLSGTSYRKGARNADIALFQKVFVALGLMVQPPQAPIGYFGDITETAAKKFQCTYGIVCSGPSAATGWGYLGPKTAKAVNALLINGILTGTTTQSISTWTAAGTK